MVTPVRLLLLCLLTVILGACQRLPLVPPYQLPAGPSGGEAWRKARARFEGLKARQTELQAYTMNVTMRLRRRGVGSPLQARGAIAVHPPDALRMILLGPGGTTALDLWMCGEAFRLSIPAAGVLRRGDGPVSPEQLRGLPVGFLRWWFLRPLSGRLLSFSPPTSRDLGWRYVLRDRQAVVDVWAKETEDAFAALRIRRASHTDDERITVDGGLCGRVQYLQKTTGIDLSVRCESMVEEPPPDRAFVDPEYPARSCLAALEGR